MDEREGHWQLLDVARCWIEEKDTATCCLQIRTLLPLIWKRRTLLTVEWKRCTLPAIGWKEEVRVHSIYQHPFWPLRRWPKTTARWKHSGNVFSAETAVTPGIVVFEGTRTITLFSSCQPCPVGEYETRKVLWPQLFPCRECKIQAVMQFPCAALHCLAPSPPRGGCSLAVAAGWLQV